MKLFMLHYRNAKKAIEQIRNGEWTPRYNSVSHEYLTAHKGNLELWLGNGTWLCEITYNYFGLFWRHYVWFAAARKLKLDADRSLIEDL